MSAVEEVAGLLGPEGARSVGEWPAGSSFVGSTAVALPADVEQVQAVLAWAVGAGVTVVPCGTGMHFEHRALPEACVLLSSERLSGLEIYESADLTLTAGAGTRLSDLKAPMADFSQWLPFDPPDADRRTLGGLIGAGRTGPVWAGYGALRNHVLGATVVCGDGRVLRLGGRVVKNVAGFDLLRPVVGSRGSLAMIVSATVRLFPMPAVDRFLTLGAADLEEAVRVVRAIAMGPVRSASVVLEGSGSSFRVLLRLQGAAVTVAADRSALEAHAGVDFAELLAEDAVVRHTEVRDAGWLEPFVLQVGGLPSRLGDVLRAASALPGARYVADGHAGTVRVSFDGSDDSTDALLAALREAVAQGGGSLRWVRGPADAAPSLQGGPSEAARDLERGVKTLFDPVGVYPKLPR